MHPLDLYIVYVKGREHSKFRPVLVFAFNDEVVALYPITTSHDNKSDRVKALHFMINDWKEAGLKKISYVDVANRLWVKRRMLDNKEPIGKLSNKDAGEFLKFALRMKRTTKDI